MGCSGSRIRCRSANARHARKSLLGGDAACAEVLFGMGADINAADRNGLTPIHNTPLHLAAYYGRVANVEVLISKGADDKIIEIVGLTSLHYAAMYGHIACVEALTGKGADLEAKDLFGFTPLHLAASQGHNACVKHLSDMGADLYTVDESDWAPLHSAARWPLHLAATYGHIACVEVLRERSPSKNPNSVANEKKKMKLSQAAAASTRALGGDG